MPLLLLLKRVFVPSLCFSWKRFEDKYITWFLMKPEARKNRDYLFSIFHKLNLEDAVNYVTEVRAGMTFAKV